MKDDLIKQGQYLKELRIANNLTQTEVADKLGVTHPTIVRYEKGEIGRMKSSTIQRLAEIYNVDPISILGIDLKDKGIEPVLKGRKLPILGTICAGDGVWCEENYEGYFIADPEIKNADFVVTVSGDSMINDNIKDGDKAFLKSTNYVENGRIAAVLLKDENNVMLKRIYVKEDHAILQPSNPDYSPITTDDFLILGELVGVYHKVE